MAQSWTDNQMVVNIGEEGTYDTVHCNLPNVIKDGSTYKMWYGGKDASNYRILYCDSPDGLNWSNHQMVVNFNVEGTYDTAAAMSPTVIKDGSTYKMWYSGQAAGNVRRILYCTSSNGTTWSNHQMVVNLGSEGTYDTVRCQAPTVIKDGSIYKMWYSGYDGTNFRIIYCDSSNGTTWSNHQMVVNIGVEGTISAYHPVVKYDTDSSLYRMWYSGSDGVDLHILYCDSVDGLTWLNHKIVMSKGAEGTYDTTYVFEPTVLLDDDGFKMWYSGDDGTNWRIIYARAKYISGALSEALRIVIINESDWSIENNEEKSGETYYIATTTGAKLVAARKSDGESVIYGNVTPQ